MDTRKFIPPEKVDKFLKSFYDDPATGLRGRDAMFAKISKDYTGISRRRIAEFLKNQETAQIHKEVKHIPITRPAVLRKEGQFAVDLTFLKKNDPASGSATVLTASERESVGTTRTRSKDDQILFTCIDQFSKYAWARIVPNKTGKTIAAAMQYVIDDCRATGATLPTLVRSDNGSEFKAKEFSAVLTAVKAKQRFSEAFNPRQNAMIERFNKTIKGMIYRFLTQWNMRKLRQPDLDKLVSNYNETRHSTTEVAPTEIHAAAPGADADAKKSNANDAALLAHANMKHRAQKLVAANKSTYPDLHIGDKVRVAKRTESSWRATRQLKKYSYMRNWTYDIFTIAAKTRGTTTKAVTYSLKDSSGALLVTVDEIPKQFTRQDLQEVDPDKLVRELEKDEYVVERVVAKKVDTDGVLYQVEFKGYKKPEWVAPDPGMKAAIARFEKKTAGKAQAPAVPAVGTRARLPRAAKERSQTERKK